MGLDVGIKGINFKEGTALEKLKENLTMNLSSNKNGKERKFLGNLFTNNLSEPLDKTERALLRTAAALLILFVIYCTFSALINNQMNNKITEAQSSQSNTQAQIKLVNSDNSKIEEATSKYSSIIKNLEELRSKTEDANSLKKSIPNLLTAIMSGMPEGVQITSIKNTSDRHIEIIAKSRDYNQLGFFKAKLKTDTILNNVVSTAGEKSNDIITMKIEGDLP